MLQPHRGTEREGWHAGTADALWRAAPLIRQYGPDALLVLSADAVYKLDYRQVVDAHLDSGGEVAMVTADVDPAEAARYGVVQLDGALVRGPALLPQLAADGTACAYPLDGYWRDVGRRAGRLAGRKRD